MDTRERYIGERTDYKDIFQIVVRHSPNGILVSNKDLEIEMVNISAESLTGRSREQMIGQKLYTVFPCISYLNLMNDPAESMVASTVSINGKNMYTKLIKIANEHEIVAIVFMIQDLDDEIKLNIELQKSQLMIQELERILESSFDGILVTDGNGNVLLVNQSYERITAITKEELYGKNMKDLINPVWMKNSVVFLAIQEKKPISLSHTTRENKHIIVTGTPVINEEGVVTEVVVNARDISEIYELREELQKAKEMEKLYFSNINTVRGDEQNGNIVVVSEAIKDVFALAHKVSSFDATVLIEGESGSGKEEIAKYIHNHSLRKDKPLVTINCGAIPEQLLESELFGYEKGAFTGASREGKIGLYETANGGTLFLDEIGEMPLNLQVKLLRVLETSEVNRVGSSKPVKVDVRIIAATNKHLEEQVKLNEFREDLYYRLNVIQIEIPPLRERVEDIAPLALHFLQQFNVKYGQDKKLTYDAIKGLEEHAWTGNIRQLKNTVENMVVVSNNEYLQVNDLPWYRAGEIITGPIRDQEIMPLDKAVEQVERAMLKKAFEKYKSTRKIARVLEIDQSTVARKLKKYELTT